MIRARKRDVADQLLADDQPLDTQEQQAVIVALEEQHLQQNRTFKIFFATLSILIGTLFVYAAYQQHIRPYEARYTGELQPVTKQQSVTIVLFLQGVALLAAFYALLKELPRKGDHEKACMPAAIQLQLLLGSATALAGTGCVYWFAAMQRSIQKYGFNIGAKWELLWLPLLPLGHCLLCWYVVHSIQSMGRDVKRLRQMQYDFKKV